MSISGTAPQTVLTLTPARSHHQIETSRRRTFSARLPAGGETVNLLPGLVQTPHLWKPSRAAPDPGPRTGKALPQLLQHLPGTQRLELPSAACTQPFPFGVCLSLTLLTSFSSHVCNPQVPGTATEMFMRITTNPAERQTQQPPWQAGKTKMNAREPELRSRRKQKRTRPCKHVTPLARANVPENHGGRLVRTRCRCPHGGRWYRPQPPTSGHEQKHLRGAPPASHWNRWARKPSKSAVQRPAAHRSPTGAQQLFALPGEGRWRAIGSRKAPLGFCCLPTPAPPPPRPLIPSPTLCSILSRAGRTTLQEFSPPGEGEAGGAAGKEERKDRV